MPALRKRDRPPAHRPASRLQTLDQPAARPTLPLPSELFGLFDGGDRALWRAQGQLAHAQAPGTLSSSASGRLRSGAAARSIRRSALPRAWKPLMSSTLIVNARLVNEGREYDGDLRIEDGRIGQ